MKNFTLKKNDLPEVVDLAAPYKFSHLYVDRSIPLEQVINSFFKRVFDLTASFFLLVFFFSWMLPVIALLIKLDSKGPVFFFQKRNKRNGEVFTCVKFRTMIVNSEADVLAVTENDIRITGLGLFLRRHHLDELPQLIHVLWGDMSLVGPRPYMISDNEKYDKLIENYAVRLRVKPGITGLAQVIDYVNPVNGIEYMQQRVNKDLYYVYNWSPGLDLTILFRTFFRMLGIK